MNTMQFDHMLLALSLLDVLFKPCLRLANPKKAKNARFWTSNQEKQQQWVKSHETSQIS